MQLAHDTVLLLTGVLMVVCLLEIEDNVTEHHHQCSGKSSNSSSSNLTDNEQFRINSVVGAGAAPLPIILQARGSIYVIVLAKIDAVLY